MKASPVLTIAVAVQSAAADRAGSKCTVKDGSLLAHFANSFIARAAPVDFHYTGSTLYLGLLQAASVQDNETITAWVQRQVDGVVLEDGTIKGWNYTKYSLDDYRIANQYLDFYDRTGEEKYKSAAAIVRAQLDRHPRTPTGGFWHRQPTYPDQMWLDGIFMADSFYAKWTRRFDADNATAWDDILRQYDLVEEHTRNATSGLLYHGYDEGKSAVWADPTTGASPLVWDRAVGWYFLSLIETIRELPASHPGRARMLGYFTTLAAALKRWQDPGSGGWWLIMDEQYAGDDGRNYIESSGTAMFAAGWLQGMRHGLLDKAAYLAPAQRAYELLAGRFVVENAEGLLDWEGTVEVGSLKGDASYEYYTGVPLATNDFKGAGPFMLAAAEWESWAAQEACA